MNKLTSKKTLAAAAIAGSVAFVGSAFADVDGKLVINGEIEIVTETTPPAHLADAMDEIVSGWKYRADETQALQMDDFDNPGMIFVDIALDDWNKVEGTEDKSCASCHDNVETSMKGVRAQYPKWNEGAQEVRTLAMQINSCRTDNMGAEALNITKGKMARMEALVGLQSRGMPMNVAIDGPVAAMWEQGKEMYYARTGQLELSCANCHEDSYGLHIRADFLSQGQTNGFPVYRLKNAKLNTAHGRFKGCVRDTRAQTYKPGSADFVALELYVASRGNGLSVETPSVRN